MKATEGNGGAPLVLHRGFVEKPLIPRGLMFPKCRPLPGADRLTFDCAITAVGPDKVVRGYRLTYHDAQVISDGTHTAVQVFVGPSDVVTWERL